MYSQYVTDDPDAPHVGGQIHRLEADHLRRHKLWSPMHHLQRCVAICHTNYTLFGVMKYSGEAN